MKKVLVSGSSGFLGKHLITHLNKKGVEIEKNMVWDERDTSIYFRDPSGNSVELASETLYK